MSFCIFLHVIPPFHTQVTVLEDALYYQCEKKPRMVMRVEQRVSVIVQSY
jgi:hypothetical protein